MNKAFVRESDSSVDYCPRCGSKGDPVGQPTLKNYLTEAQLRSIAATASFCPAANCPVAYFDTFKRVVLAADLARPVFPKDPRALVCACFGLTLADIEHDAAENQVARVRQIVEKSKSPDARCTDQAANGRPCTGYVQKCYLDARAKPR